MRAAWLGLLVFGFGAMGATCTPLLDFETTPDTIAPSTRLTIDLTAPNTEREVPAGTLVPIEWVALNLTGEDAIVTVVVVDRSDFTETILAGGVRVTGTGLSESTTWDTTGFIAGEYSIRARIESATRADSDTATARITVNEPPQLTFVAPAEDSVLEPEEPEEPDEEPADPTLEISWRAEDPDGDGTVRIGLDTSLDHEDGDEIFLLERSIIEGEDSFSFTGVDENGDGIEPGTYFLFAVLSDAFAEDVFVDAAATITIPEPDEEEPEPLPLEFTNIQENVDFRFGLEPLEIEWTLDEEEDVLVDLRIDTDENHFNGNETTILSQRLIEAGDAEQSFEWGATDIDGNDIPQGIYRLYLTINRGSGSPEVVEAPGLIFRRSARERPLIGLLDPNEDEDLTAGEFLLIRWRDNDPSGDATITLVLDDDPSPNEPTETDQPEREILSGRDASAGGVQNSFSFQIPADLAPGRWFIFAYVDRDDAAPFDNISIAAGNIVITDPDAD